ELEVQPVAMPLAIPKLARAVPADDILVDAPGPTHGDPITLLADLQLEAAASIDQAEQPLVIGRAVAIPFGRRARPEVRAELRDYLDPQLARPAGRLIRDVARQPQVASHREVAAPAGRARAARERVLHAPVGAAVPCARVERDEIRAL